MVAPLQLPCTLFTNLLQDLAAQISATCDHQLDPDDLCLRYANLIGEVFELDSLFSLIGALGSYRPEWCRRQDDGLKFLSLRGLHPALHHATYVPSERSQYSPSVNVEILRHYAAGLKMLFSAEFPCWPFCSFVFLFRF